MNMYEDGRKEKGREVERENWQKKKSNQESKKQIENQKIKLLQFNAKV